MSPTPKPVDRVVALPLNKHLYMRVREGSRLGVGVPRGGGGSRDASYDFSGPLAANTFFGIFPKNSSWGRCRRCQRSGRVSFCNI